MRLRAWRARMRPERDSGMTAIEFVILTPVFFFILLASVQFALYFFAYQVAESAAQAGARTARAEADHPSQNWQGDARQKATDYVQGLGPTLLTGATPTAVDNGNHVVGVRVTANVVKVIPLLDLTIDVTSVGPVERFICDGCP